jgi:hypothetical protein
MFSRTVHGSIQAKNQTVIYSRTEPNRTYGLANRLTELLSKTKMY